MKFDHKDGVEFSEALTLGRGRELLESVVDWMKDYFVPEDIFNYEQLRDWAKDNGFVEEE